MCEQTPPRQNSVELGETNPLPGNGFADTQTLQPLYTVAVAQRLEAASPREIGDAGCLAGYTGARGEAHIGRLLCWLELGSQQLTQNLVLA